MMSIQEMREKYIEYRMLSGLKPSLNSGLVYFLKFCSTKGNKITQEAVDEWFVKKESESPISYQTRFYHALSFIKHANERKWIKIIEPKRPRPAKSVYVPHMMTQTELKNFFDSCDSMKPTPFHKKSRKMIQRQKLTSIIVPVFYRLMYSTGMRPNEVRLLERKDVNFETGEVIVHNTKGYNEHSLVLHDSMLDLLKVYDTEMDENVPKRRMMFPNESDEPYNAEWQWRMFKTHWEKYNDTKCVAYCFRHNYAITNINKLIRLGTEATEQLVALSRSMGHASLKETLHYYNFVPQFGKLLEDLGGDELDELLPNIEGYESKNQCD